METVGGPSKIYYPRIVDGELDLLCQELPAVALEGPRAVGKTETALRRANTVFRLDYDVQLEIARAGHDPQQSLLARTVGPSTPIFAPG